MEEKERYSLEEFDDIDWELAIVDNKLGKSLTFGEIKDLLNQQDKRIKELEEENGYIVFVDGHDENGNEIHKQEFVKYKDKFKELVEENQLLKEQLKEELQNK